jgi:hypothetical protein
LNRTIEQEREQMNPLSKFWNSNLEKVKAYFGFSNQVFGEISGTWPDFQHIIFRRDSGEVNYFLQDGFIDEEMLPKAFPANDAEPGYKMSVFFHFHAFQRQDCVGVEAESSPAARLSLCSPTSAIIAALSVQSLGEGMKSEMPFARASFSNSCLSLWLLATPPLRTSRLTLNLFRVSFTTSWTSVLTDTSTLGAEACPPP